LEAKEMTWKKYPTEEINIPGDWSDLCIKPDGSPDPITGNVGVEVVAPANGLVASIITTTDFISVVKLVGGTEKTRINLRFSINTQGGNKFRPIKTVIVLSDNDPSWIGGGG
jgi:hypothetical protein